MNSLHFDATEKLRHREARSDLPLPLQMRLYLDPGALFKDASRGPLLARQQARRYNVRYRWMLLPYFRRWIAIAVFFFASVAPAEVLGADQPAFTLLAAALALASCVAVTVSAQTLVAYLLLGAGEERGAGPPGNYDDLIASKRAQAERDEAYGRELRDLYQRHRELEREKQPIIESMRRLREKPAGPPEG